MKRKLPVLVIFLACCAFSSHSQVLKPGFEVTEYRQIVYNGTIAHHLIHYMKEFTAPK
jgi:hypothetical protein